MASLTVDRLLCPLNRFEQSSLCKPACLKHLYLCFSPIHISLEIRDSLVLESYTITT
jgi:hypothetical protein